MADERHDIERPDEAVPVEAESASTRRIAPPAVDIYETDDGSILLADVPGCDESSVDASIADGVLTIRATRAAEEFPDHEATLTEYRPYDYERSFSVSDLVDTEKVTASVRDGVLRLELPKAEEAKPKKIEIKLG